jgi:hypothetical protein
VLACNERADLLGVRVEQFLEPEQNARALRRRRLAPLRQRGLRSGDRALYLVAIREHGFADDGAGCRIEYRRAACAPCLDAACDSVTHEGRRSFANGCYRRRGMAGGLRARVLAIDAHAYDLTPTSACAAATTRAL